MCEISIVNPRDVSKGEQLDIITAIYEAMGDGAGMAYISETDDGTEFTYDVYSSASPSIESLRSFINRHSDNAVRCVMHGRMATCGEVSDANAHPIEVDCDECDMEYVVHNGMVYDHHRRRPTLQGRGHTFQTPVDSEVIAHSFGEVPSSFDEADAFFEGQAAYVLLGRESVYIHASNLYHLTERGTCARAYRSFGPSSREENYQKVILTPTNGN